VHARREESEALRLEESMECGMQATYLWAVVVFDDNSDDYVELLLDRRSSESGSSAIYLICYKIKTRFDIFWLCFFYLILLHFLLLSSLYLYLAPCPSRGSSRESVDNNKVSIVKRLNA